MMALCEGKDVCINVISKSGTTTEPAVTFRIFRKMLEEKYGVRNLPSDFKKKEGYKKSTLLSKEYGLYRQDYCGCEFSRLAAERMRSKEENECKEMYISRLKNIYAAVKNGKNGKKL